jgi:hypothetical protein
LCSRITPICGTFCHKLADLSDVKIFPGKQFVTPTALVHEAWLRLVGDGDHDWNSRGHFFGAAAEAMRRILVENARRKKRLKHGGRLHRTTLTGLDVAASTPDDQLLAVDEALLRLVGLTSSWNWSGASAVVSGRKRVFFEVAREAEDVADSMREGFSAKHGQSDQISPTTVTPLPSDPASDFAAGAFRPPAPAVGHARAAAVPAQSGAGGSSSRHSPHSADTLGDPRPDTDSSRGVPDC